MRLVRVIMSRNLLLWLHSESQLGKALSSVRALLQLALRFRLLFSVLISVHCPAKAVSARCVGFCSALCWFL
jgi:hypothetical protein